MHSVIDMQQGLIVLYLVLRDLGLSTEIENFDNLDDRRLIQKAVYLVQVCGLDLGYRFGWYKHGPYSPKLALDCFRLIELTEERQSSKDLKLVPDIRNLLKPLQEFLQTQPELFTTPLSRQHWLEVVASLDYLLHVRRLPPPEARQLLHSEKEHLLHKYNLDELDAAIDRAEEAIKSLRRH